MPVGTPISRVHVAQAQADDKQDDCDLDHHDGRIEAGAFFDPHHENGRDHQSDDEGRHIHSDFHAKQVRRMQQIMRAFEQLRRLHPHDLGDFIEKGLGARNERSICRLRHLAGDNLLRLPQPGPVVVGQPKRHLDMQDIEQLDKVVGPAGRNRARAHGIFEGQVPADNPGKDLTQGGIGIGVGTARQRNHGREFRIAKCREGATQSGENEGKHQGGAGVVRTQARHHKNAGSDDRAHPERSQLERAEGAFQAVFAAFLGLIEERVQRLFRQQIRHSCVYPFRVALQYRQLATFPTTCNTPERPAEQSSILARCTAACSAIVRHQ